MVMQTLKIKRIHPTVKLPRYAHATDAGFDLYLPEPVEVAVDERLMVGCGFAIALPAGSMGRLLHKSSRVKEGLTIASGVIDEGYRGEIKVILWNISDQPLTYPAGTPYAQILVLPVLHPNIIETDELSETPRGEGGFGSTHTVVDGQWTSIVK